MVLELEGGNLQAITLENFQLTSIFRYTQLL